MDPAREDSPMPDRPAIHAATTAPAAAVPIPVPSNAAAASSNTVSADGIQAAFAGSASSAGDVTGSVDSTASQLANDARDSWSSPNTSSASSPTSEEQKEPPPRPHSGWFPIPEDHSVAEPAEAARIEAAGESSALDEAHWRKKFTELTDPEYAIDELGRIDWVISPFNGTKKSPQYDHLLCSEYVLIGGFYWRLKIFPKGIEGPYLATSLECKPPSEVNQPGNAQNVNASCAASAAPGDQNPPSSSSLPWRVPAQFEIVIYNLDEPRVHFSKGSSQSFNTRYPSCSFRRFSPINVADLGLRLPGQRCALLRNDKVAMVAYIRTFRDDTGCLFLRQADYWDSFSISGLRGIHPTSHRARAGQSVLAAVVSWLYLPPIRRIVSSIKTASEAVSPSSSYAARFACSFHFLSNFVQWKTPGSATNAQIDLLERALDWHGAVLGDQAEVFEVFELFKDILLKEAAFLKLEHVKKEIEALGPTHLNLSYVSTKSVKDVQSLLSPDSVKNIEDDRIKALVAGTATNETSLLQLQLPRQRFDDEKRKWKKSRRAYDINEEIQLPSARYKLHAIITHEDMDLRMRSFSTIVCADGHNFYKYGHDYQRVLRLTRRQALIDSRENAYATIYIRQDAQDDSLLRCDFDLNPPASESVPDAIVSPGTGNTLKSTTGLTFVDSRVFIGSQHPGFVDLYNPGAGRVHEIALNGVNDAETAKFELERIFIGEEDNKICFVLELDAISSRFKPELADSDFGELEEPLSHLVRWPVYLVHVADREILEVTRPRPNKPADSSCPEDPQGPLLVCGNTEQSGTSASVATSEMPTSSTEDTEMVDAEEGDDDNEEDADDNLEGHIFGLDREQLVFVKYFDGVAQSMTGISCFVTDPNKPVRTTVLQSLPAHISKDQQFQLYEEQRMSFESAANDCVRALNDSYSLFKDEFEDAECSIIVEPIISQEKKEEILRDGGVADVGKFLYYLYARECDYKARVTQDVGKLRRFRRKTGIPECTKLMFHDKCVVVTKDYYGSPYFKGQMSKGYAHGKGHEITVSGEIYTGGFRMGMRSGTGHLTLPNNNTYQGDFDEGKPHGTGKQVDSMTGNTYTGGFRRGKKRGRGTTEWQQAEEEAKVCRVCYDKEQDCAFYPCGHVCACYECAKQAGTCPMCHRDGSRAFKLFFAS